MRKASSHCSVGKVGVEVGGYGSFPLSLRRRGFIERSQPQPVSSCLMVGYLRSPEPFQALPLAAHSGIDLPNGKALQRWVLAALSQAFLGPLISCSPETALHRWETGARRPY